MLKTALFADGSGFHVTARAFVIVFLLIGVIEIAVYYYSATCRPIAI